MANGKLSVRSNESESSGENLRDRILFEKATITEIWIKYDERVSMMRKVTENKI